MLRFAVFLLCVVLSEQRVVDRRSIVQRSNATQVVRGVNLGGWLVMEPFIVPSIFERINQNLPDFNASNYKIVDEYTYWQYGAQAVGVDYIEMIQHHWATWVTEDHISKLAHAGITHLRVPVGYWYFDIRPGEPWNNGAKVFPDALEYLVDLTVLAQRYGLKVLFDLHCAPGSQNGFDNSGRRGDVHFLDGDNMNRTKIIIKKVTEWVLANVDPSVVFGVEVLNEPNTFDSTVGNAMWSAMINDYYPHSYAELRNLSSDIQIVLQTAFKPLTSYNNYMPPSQGYYNVWLDDHNYQSFGQYNKWAYDNDGWTRHLGEVCNNRAVYTNPPLWTFVGEFSLAVTDCTKWLLGINRIATPIVDGRSDVCDYYNKPVTQFTSDYRTFLNNYVRSQMDVFENVNGWFFWNFRTENSPEWDFLLGLAEGWIPNPVYNREPYVC